MFSIVIAALADDEFERFGTTKLLDGTCNKFCKGKIAVTDWSELELCFRYYDYAHEFKKDPYLSYALLKVVLNMESSSQAVTAKKKRAIVELAALSREMVTRGIGSYTGACYWWQLFRRQGHSELSHAAAVINLMLIENYFDDNMTKLLSSARARDEFTIWCEEFHRKYSQFKRERVFLSNLQMAVYSTEPQKGVELAYEIKKLLPLRNDEHGCWAGEVYNFLPGIFLSASRKALELGNEAAAEEFSILASETSNLDISRVANQHSAFEQ